MIPKPLAPALTDILRVAATRPKPESLVGRCATTVAGVIRCVTVEDAEELEQIMKDLRDTYHDAQAPVLGDAMEPLSLRKAEDAKPNIKRGPVLDATGE